VDSVATLFGSGTVYLRIWCQPVWTSAQVPGLIYDVIAVSPKSLAANKAAYRAMQQRGFRTQLQGVTMHRPNEPGYSRPNVFVLDDWR